MRDVPTIFDIKGTGPIKGIGLIEELICSRKQSDSFYETLVKSLPGIFYVLDDNFKLHLWHRDAEVITGYTPEDFISRGKTWHDLFGEWQMPAIRKAMQEVFKTGVGIIEAELLVRDGRQIPYLFTGVRADFDDKAYLVGIGIDISQRKQAESALIESEALYRAFAERMTEGVTLLNGSRILFCNRAFAKLLGYSMPNELVGKDVLSFINKDFDIYFKELINSLETGMSTERFFQARWIKDKELEIWVEGRGNVMRWRGTASVLLTARDITEAKLREITMEEEAAHLRKENITLRSSIIKERYRFGDIIGKSSAMQEIYELILNSAATNANVILYGESGTGKELVAKAIHKLSSRSAKSFVPVNCAAIPENLIESEFFGYKKGAFTGAVCDKPGFLDMADGGTLFLDEVGEVGLNIQAKLLRAIDGGGYSPVGSNLIRHSDFRIIAATNKNLMELSKRGLFREDFFYRIHIIPIYLPPLRKRREDIPLLVEHFLRLHCPGKRIPTLPGKLLESLISYDWPGNIRELQNVIQRFLTFGRINFISPAECEPTDYWGTPERAPEKARTDFNLHEQTGNLEKEVILETLKKFNWNKSKAANALMISRKTLGRKLKKLGLL
jgi:PAS domain S-box-containing protein